MSRLPYRPCGPVPAPARTAGRVTGPPRAAGRVTVVARAAGRVTVIFARSALLSLIRGRVHIPDCCCHEHGYSAHIAVTIRYKWLRVSVSPVRLCGPARLPFPLTRPGRGRAASHRWSRRSRPAAPGERGGRRHAATAGPPPCG